MGSANRAGSPSPDGAADVLHESPYARVVRVHDELSHTSIIQKEALGRDATRRARNERAILERLAEVNGVSHLAERDPGESSPRVLLLDDVHAPSLATRFEHTPLPVSDLFALSCDLADSLAGIHRRGVIHRDINPENILWGGVPPRTWLIDFDLATVAAEDRPGFTHETEIVGTLAYLSPEQTGRTGRSVDQRADLYGLGTTLYELATGSPPFGTADRDPLELLHDHLARLPDPPVERNPALPVALSEIILRLLEKEPDRRYQSAEGLAHDLRLARREWAAGRDASIPLGLRDFPLRLSAPSRLVGRQAELETLETTLRQAVTGQVRGLLVGGAPGVGKSALLDQLRPLVTNLGGWLVSGKFDQYRQDAEANGVRQTIRGLGRLLLAESETAIVALRARLRDRLGANTHLLASLVPELGSLLEITSSAPEGDPASVPARLVQAELDLLATVASPQRPVVLAIDDLQWASPDPLRFVDAVLTDGSLRGVLVVGAYRTTEVDAAHPLGVLISRWVRLGVAPTQLTLSNLPAVALGEMLAEMLRVGEGEVGQLAEIIASRTEGNPFDTVQLVNALRRDGALVTGDEGWRWDPETLRRYLGHGDVVDLLTARMSVLPAETQTLLEIMACLGGEVETDLLRAAGDLSPEDVERHLRPALADGLLTVNSSTGSLRFGHDRVQQAALGHLALEARVRTRLAIARRLFERYPAHSAEQYVRVVDAVTDPAEVESLIGLFRSSAAHARDIADHVRVERFVSAALALTAPAGPVTVDAATQAELAAERHQALYNLGMLGEADKAYDHLLTVTDDPIVLAEAAQAQISGLSNQDKPQQAVELGLGLLSALGSPVPRDRERLLEEIDNGMSAMYQWISDTEDQTDLDRPECADTRVLAVAGIINRMIQPAFFCGHPVMPWLVLAAARMWAENGPARALVGALCNASFATIALREDYRTGHAVVRRVLLVSQERGYEPDTSHVRNAYALSSACWFEPLEEVIHQARLAHEGLVRGGEPHFACHTFYTTLPDLFDCAATLDEVSAEAEAALGFAARTGNDQNAAMFVAYRQLVRALRGETTEPGGFDDDSFDERVHLGGLDTNPPAACYLHLLGATLSAVLGDGEAMAHRAECFLPLMPYLTAGYVSVSAHLFLALTALQRLRSLSPQRRDEATGNWTDVDTERDWLAARASDAPGTLDHLVWWLEAERSWLGEDFQATASAFDTALRRLSSLQRPWHRALITERFALFHLENGLIHGGTSLLSEARAAYAAWGATAKVAQLDHGHPRPNQPAPATSAHSRRSLGRDSSGAYSAEEIDLLGVLTASQALSSETNLDRLRARVTSILSAMTGATSVKVVLREETRGWLLLDDEEHLPLETAATRLPMSAFRYAERTRQPLNVDDATSDERFRRDPYVTPLTTCSLLVVPILALGVPKAMLILENRLSRAAFASDRLEGVLLIAGQLAVSLDNALLYASLERKVAERTQELGLANRRLELLSVTDALTGLANRRQLNDVLAREWSMASVQGNHLAIAMIDVDFFKLYNDRYGHPAGDSCLRQIAGLVVGSVRSSDLVARYGGEEFVVVMPGTDLSSAGPASERVRVAVASAAEPHEGSPLGVVTVSIGTTATVPAGSSGPELLLERADTLLYQAKNAGRNQVVVSE